MVSDSTDSQSGFGRRVEHLRTCIAFTIEAFIIGSGEQIDAAERSETRQIMCAFWCTTASLRPVCLLVHIAMAVHAAIGGAREISHCVLA
jgi:hypothetical protein